MKIKLKSKWTSVGLVNGWRHYEVSEYDSEKNIFKLFAVCDKKVSIFVTQSDLKNDKKWVAGWKQIVSS
jgi:tryptophan-rich hypothetical protein